MENLVSGRSISGFILSLFGVLFSLQWKAQKNVIKWVALSKAKVVMYVILLLGSMKISVKLPVMVRVSNVGTVFMASDLTTTSYMKHVNIRCMHLNEYVEDGLVETIFTKSAENDSNILTKNLGAELHKKHSKKMLGEKLEGVSSFGNI